MPTPEIIENAFYTAEELSELFGISYRNMCLLIKTGQIKGGKIGKNWFVTGRSLLKAFDESDNSNLDSDDTAIESEEAKINNHNIEE